MVKYLNQQNQSNKWSWSSHIKIEVRFPPNDDGGGTNQV